MKKLIVLIMSMLLMFSLSSCSKLKPNATTDQQAIADINGEKISKEMYDKYVKMGNFNYQMRKMTQDTGESVSAELPSLTTEEESAVKDDVFEQLVFSNLINQEADKQNLKISKEELDNAYKSMIENKGQLGYDEWLQGTGLTEEDTMYIIKTQLVFDKLSSAVTKTVSVSDDEARKYYDENYSKQLEISHILVADENQANNVLSQLKNGANFEELAKEVSICPSKSQGGHLGTNAPGQWVQEFEVAAAALKAGEITSKPVKTEFGYHIIKADNAKDFEQSKNMIKMQMQKQKETEALENYTKTLRDQANVVDYRVE